MTRRERLETQANRRREWADIREQKAESAMEASSRAVEGIPFGQAAALLAVQGKSPRTTEAYRSAVRRFLAWAQGPPTVELLAAYVAELKGKASASTVNGALYGCKAAIMQAAQGMPARELAVLKTGLDSIRAVKPSVPEVRVVSAQERKQIEAQLQPRLAVLVRFLYASACRISEALAILGSDLQVDASHTVRIRIRGKGDKERHVRIPKALLEEINALYARPGRSLLFETRRGTAISRNYVSYQIEQAARKAIGRTVSAHDYRHSRATDLYRKYGRVKAVAQYLGHSNPAMTERYYLADSFTDSELE